MSDTARLRLQIQGGLALILALVIAAIAALLIINFNVLGAAAVATLVTFMGGLGSAFGLLVHAILADTAGKPAAPPPAVAGASLAPKHPVAVFTGLFRATPRP